MARFKFAMMVIGVLWAIPLVFSQEDFVTPTEETEPQPHDFDLPDPLGTEASVPLATAAILPESNVTSDDSVQGQQEPALPGDATPIGSSGPREAIASGTTSSPQFLRLRRQAHPVPPTTVSVLPESNITSDDPVQGHQEDSLTGEATHVENSDPGETVASGQTASTSTPPQSPPFLRVRRQAHPVPLTTASSLPENNATSEESVQEPGETTSGPRETIAAGPTGYTSAPPESPPLLRVRRQGHPGAAQGGPDGDRKIWSDMMHALYRRYFQNGPLTPEQTP